MLLVLVERPAAKHYDEELDDSRSGPDQVQIPRNHIFAHKGSTFRLELGVGTCFWWLLVEEGLVCASCVGDVAGGAFLASAARDVERSQGFGC